jgi:hypothetical protein
MDENGTALAVETAPPAEAPPDPAAPVEEPQAAPASEEAAPPPAQEVDFDSVVAGFDAEDSPHAERWREYREGIEAQGFRKATEMYGPQIEQQMRRAEEANHLFQVASQNYSTLAGRIQKLADDGLVSPDDLANALRSVPQAWQATQAIGEQAQRAAFENGTQQGAAAGSLEVTEILIKEAAKLTGKPTIESRYLPRVQQAKNGQWFDGQAMLRELIDDIRKAGYEPGLKDGANGAAEAAKVKERKGEVPPQNIGTGGGGIGTMADADQAYYDGKIDHATYKQYRKQFGVG